MSLTTSRGRATVGQLCEAFGISRQAYYAARNAPQRDSTDRRARLRRPERRGPWVSDATLIEKIQAVVAEFPAWGVRKVWAYLKRLGTVVSRKRVWKRMKAWGSACRRSPSGASRCDAGTSPCRSRTGAGPRI